MVELLNSGADAYGIDLSPRMIQLARTKLIQASLNPRRVAVADVTRLPLADRQFDTVISTGAIALFRASTQRAALTEMARVAGVEVQLLESYERRPGWYWGRFWARLFDGMRPIPRAVLRDSGLDCSHQWDILGGAFSYLRCTKR